MLALDSCRVLGQNSVTDTRRNLEQRDKIQRDSDENKKGIRNKARRDGAALYWKRAKSSDSRLES